MKQSTNNNTVAELFGIHPVQSKLICRCTLLNNKLGNISVWFSLQDNRLVKMKKSVFETV